MESSGPLYLVKDIYYKSKGKIVLRTIVIGDNTSTKQVFTHLYMLPKGQVDKGGILPCQILVPN